MQRLYSAGALTSYVVASETGPHRKYYGITPDGRTQLKRQTDDWTSFSATVTGILQGVAS
ncbi:MAG: PadR family transcriptional regulator [Marmoricola sp.]